MFEVSLRTITPLTSPASEFHLTWSPTLNSFVISFAPSIMWFDRHSAGLVGQRKSPVYFTKYDIDGADGDHHIRDQAPDAHFFERLKVSKGRRSHVYARRLGCSVADNVVAHFSSRR